MTRKLVALDYDGTIVSQAWPDHGKPEPNAAAVIKRLMEKYDVTIFTARIAPFDMEGRQRSGIEVAKEVKAIDRKLKGMGLPTLPIHQLPWKIGAAAYVDDKSIEYRGDWLDVERKLHAFLD